MTHKIGIITYNYRALPAYYKPDDYLLKEALSRRGADAIIFSWTNPRIDPTMFDALVLRSCWDSHHDPAAFMSWLQQVEADRPRLINPYSVVVWSYHKERYLSDLTTALRTSPSPQGQIVPSVFVSTQASALENRSPFRSAEGKSLSNILAELEQEDGSTWRGQDMIIKPTISASGENTFRIVRTPTTAKRLAGSKDVLSISEAEAQFKRLLQDDRWPGVIIQPLIPGIQDGEYSLIYIAGQFSHAVHKMVEAHDFKNRTEKNRIGIRPETLPPRMLTFADQIMALVQAQFPLHAITYARIDMVQDSSGTPILLECELVEPSLQFVRVPEIFYHVRETPTENEIKKGEAALDKAIGRFVEVIIAECDRLKRMDSGRIAK